MQNPNSTAKIDASKSLGTWVNTWEDTKMIESFELSQSDNGLNIKLRGKQSGHAPGYLGEFPVYVVADSPDTHTAVAFHAACNTTDFDLFLAMNLNHGILVVACFCYFKDGSKGSDFFAREFFYLM